MIISNKFSFAKDLGLYNRSGERIKWKPNIRSAEFANLGMCRDWTKYWTDPLPPSDEQADDLFGLGGAVYVQRPVKRTISLIRYKCRSVPRYDRFFLSMPYVAFSIPYRFFPRIKDKQGYYFREYSVIPSSPICCLFAKDSELESVGGESHCLYSSMLPNIDSNGVVCFGESKTTLCLLREKTLDSLCKKVIDCFWSSVFGLEQMGSILNSARNSEGEMITRKSEGEMITRKDDHLAEIIEFFVRWEQRTKADPQWIPYNMLKLPFDIESTQRVFFRSLDCAIQ